DDPHDEERTRKFARLLRKESRRLSKLVADVLDVARLGSGRKPRLVCEDIDLERIVREMVEAFAHRAEEVGVRVAIVRSPDLRGPLVVHADRVAVERIASNLIDNALKYGGGKDGEVKIELGRDGACAWLRVADRGPGVPPGDEERIFDDFYRARFEDHGVQGAGLGLSIARRLARAMEGDIVLERG